MRSGDAWSLARPTESSAPVRGRRRTHTRLIPGTLLLGRFRVLDAIASGGQGSVFSARDEQSGVHVAIKVPRADRRTRRFQRESASIARARHDNVVRLLAFEPDHRPPLLIMELVGPTLSDVVRRSPHRRIEAVALSNVALGSLRAIEACHAVGLVHRDVKPSNIALAAEPPHEARLIDLGLAYEPSDRDTPGKFVGTARYASARALQGQPHLPMDDAWSWLYTLVHAIAGGLPWSRAASEQEILQLKQGFSGVMLCAGLPEPLDDARRALFETDGRAAPPYARLADAARALAACTPDHAAPIAWDPRAWEATQLRASFEAAAAWRTGASARHDHDRASTQSASSLRTGKR